MKGLYEARAKNLYLELECDKIYDERIEEERKRLLTTVSLDVKVALRKRVGTLEKLKDILAMSLSELCENPDEVRCLLHYDVVIIAPNHFCALVVVDFFFLLWTNLLLQ